MQINLRENEYIELRNRMDRDYAMAFLVDMVVKDPATKKYYEFPVQLNDARTFMERCLAIINADKVRYEITGVDSTVQKLLEDMYEYWFYINDINLSQRGHQKLRMDLNWYNLYRGWIGSLWLLYRVDENKFIPSIVSSDPRNMTWEFNAKGLKQFSYRKRMEVWEAEETFKTNLKNRVKKDDRFIDLQCIWTDTHELVYQAAPLSDNNYTGVQGDPLKVFEHGLGVCPGVMTAVPGQPATMSGSERYETIFSRRGEGIMAPNRRIYPMLDRLASLIASVAHQGWKSPTILASDNEEGFEEDPGKSGNIAQIGKDDKMYPWPFRDLSNALTYLNGLLTSNKQKGGLSDINYWQIQFQIASLVVAQLKDDRDGIFVPRRMANATHYSQGMEIFRRMISANKFYDVDPDLVNTDDAVEIDRSLFKDRFVISVNYTSISPEENISNYTIAAQAKALGIPRVKILREILHDDAPEETLRLADMEQAEEMNPLLKLYHMAIATDPGRLTEEQIKDDERLIIMDGIQKQLNSPTPLNALPGVASLPKIDLEKASAEKIAQKRVNQTGQNDMINARRETGG